MLDDTKRLRFEGKRALVLGGVGFIGAHLVQKLMDEGAYVFVVDNLSTGHACVPCGVMHADICDPTTWRMAGRYDFVFNLASPASPPHYDRLWLETLRVGSVGTQNALQAAMKWGAIYLHASTSEVYGDPTVHPQTENYFGNVDPTGPRAVYDESKRYAEALVSACQRKLGANTRIARIFNTYGPGMHVDDGRAVPNLIKQALKGVPLTIYGSGEQTRSFCYVDDLVEGLMRLALSEIRWPVNLGNPHEVTLRFLAGEISWLVTEQYDLNAEYLPLPQGDPTRRCPDISVALAVLQWRPQVELADGLRRTIAYFRTKLGL